MKKLPIGVQTFSKLRSESCVYIDKTPWRNFTHNDLPDSEGYYASVLYAFGLDRTRPPSSESG